MDITKNDKIFLTHTFNLLFKPSKKIKLITAKTNINKIQVNIENSLLLISKNTVIKEQIIRITDNNLKFKCLFVFLVVSTTFFILTPSNIIPIIEFYYLNVDIKKDVFDTSYKLSLSLKNGGISYSSSITDAADVEVSSS